MKKLLSTKKFQIGFTLIELLIVVTIISILIAIGAVSYTTAQRNARNAQRQSDLHKLANALEEYYADHGRYPCDDPCNTPTGGFQTAGHNCFIESFCCLLGGTIAQRVQNNNAPYQKLCKGPFNQAYINPGNPIGDDTGNAYSYFGIPKDPFAYPQSFDLHFGANGFNNTYAYASVDGQSYVITTLRYEGNPPAANTFSNTFSSQDYWDRAGIWRSTWDWGHQYAVKSPTN